MTGTNPRGIRDVGEMISRDIDFEKSAEAQRTTVKWGVDAQLDELKHLFDGLEDILSQVRVRLVQVMPDWAREHLVNCIFYPQLGFLVAVTLNPETGKGVYQGEDLADDEWVMMFTNDGLVLYKTRMMLELDSMYGDPYGQLVGMLRDSVHIKSGELISNRQGDRDCLPAWRQSPGARRSPYHCVRIVWRARQSHRSGNGGRKVPVDSAKDDNVQHD
jgi:DNA mismatch repair protein MSH5